MYGLVLLRPALVLLSLCASLLAGCVGLADDTTERRLTALLPAEALLLGEQHDAPAHQRVQSEVVQALAAHGQLAALALEMAEQGRGTQGLPPAADEARVREALAWADAAWPWRAYGPAVMAAVRAGVPVLGANLPRAQMRASMADRQLDGQLSGPALKAQQQRIRRGHCDTLPERQIGPMTRVQIARDRAMAETVRAAAAPGKTVLLLTGRGHADRTLGVPQHLPADLRVKSVGLGAAQEGETADAFDLHWPAEPGPAMDHCQALRERLAPPPAIPRYPPNGGN